MAPTDQKPTDQALMKRDVDALTQLAGTIIKTPLQLAERVRAMQQVAHVLSPAVSVAAIPEHIAINPVVVVMDPSFNADTGRGNDVYFQKSIHKSVKRGGAWEPIEVSLNANAIRRMLSASGVNITRSARTDDGSKPNYWTWESTGRIRDFDGSWRDLPPGNVEIDLRDTSAQIGEWNAADWPKVVAEAEVKQKSLPRDDQWKAKPQMGGWTADRVMAARKFGLRLAEAKSLNALGRNLGLKQIYSLEELKKPFVIFRATWNPDMSDPVTRQMVTAHELGATHMLGYPVAAAPAALPAGPDPKNVIDIEPSQDRDETQGETASAGGAVTASTTSGDQPFVPTKAAAAEPTFTVTGVIRRGEGGFYVTTKETGSEKLLTNDEDVALAAHTASNGQQLLHITTEKRGAETWIVELEKVAKL